MHHIVLLRFHLLLSASHNHHQCLDSIKKVSYNTRLYFTTPLKYDDVTVGCNRFTFLIFIMRISMKYLLPLMNSLY